jgi:hypothetical protein
MLKGNDELINIDRSLLLWWHPMWVNAPGLDICMSEQFA